MQSLTIRNMAVRTLRARPLVQQVQHVRRMADKRIEEASQKAGEKVSTSPENPSVLSSAGAVGKQFNPDGALGSIPESIGGVFSKDGAVGKQFDAAKDGLAGQVEKAVDGPSRPATEKK